MKMKIKLAMFDFDGTLVDTAPDIILATNQLLERYNHRSVDPEVIKKDIGTGLKGILYDLFPEAALNKRLELKLMNEFFEIYRDLHLKSPRIYPGVEDFLTSTPLKIAIVSNKRESLIHPILRHLRLDRFPWVRVIGGDTFPTMKPDKTPFLAAIEAAQVHLDEAVIIGDGTPDIEGAKNLGCSSIAVSFGYSPIDVLMSLGACQRIDHYSELNPTLLRL